MNLLGDIVLFLTGLIISAQVLAAFFNIIDLWATLKSAWPAVLRRLLFWTLITALLAILAGQSYRAFFFYGLGSGLVVLIINFLINRFVLSKPSRNYRGK